MKDEDKVVEIPSCSAGCASDTGSFCPECGKWFCVEHFAQHLKETGHQESERKIPWQ